MFESLRNFFGKSRTTRVDGANFSAADLTGVDFTKAILTGANFTGANLDATNFTGAKLDNAIFEGAVYTRRTIWPRGFDPQLHGAILN